jgi:hypothetical protein
MVPFADNRLDHLADRAGRFLECAIESGAVLAVSLWIPLSQPKCRACSSLPTFLFSRNTCEFHNQDTQGAGYRQRRVHLWRMFRPRASRDINSMIMELPREKEGRFWPFCFGAVAYSVLLLLI